MLTQEHESRLRKFGTYFGYPQCCIDDFVKHFGSDKSQLVKDHEGAPWLFTGYIPCEPHRKAIKTPLDLTQVLSQQPRECPTEYPRGTYEF